MTDENMNLKIARDKEQKNREEVEQKLQALDDKFDQNLQKQIVELNERFEVKNKLENVKTTNNTELYQMQQKYIEKNEETIEEQKQKIQELKNKLQENEAKFKDELFCQQRQSEKALDEQKKKFDKNLKLY